MMSHVAWGQLKGKGKGLAHRDISLHVRDIQKFEQQAPGAKGQNIMGIPNCNLHGGFIYR